MTQYGYPFERKPRLPDPRFFVPAVIAILVLIMIFFLSMARAEEIDETLAVKAILGEASNQGYQGMLAVAVGIRNRGTLQGVYGLKAKHIYNEPKYVWDLARKAWKESLNNRIHSGYMWENILDFGKPKWYNDVVEVYRYKDHIFFIEKGRTDGKIKK